MSANGSTPGPRGLPRGAPARRLQTVAAAWLAGPGRGAADTGALLTGLSEVLRDLGLPLARATTHAPTLHPSHRWVMRVWHPGGETLTLRRPRGIEATPTFHGNSVEHVAAAGEPYRVRLAGSGPLPFPVLDELHAEGLTDYLMVPPAASSGRATLSPCAASAHRRPCMRSPTPAGTPLAPRDPT